MNIQSPIILPILIFIRLIVTTMESVTAHEDVLNSQSSHPFSSSSSVLSKLLVSTTSWKKIMKQFVIPPPIVHSMNVLDSHPTWISWFGKEEPTMTVLFWTLMILLVLYIMGHVPKNKINHKKKTKKRHYWWKEEPVEDLVLSNSTDETSHLHHDLYSGDTVVFLGPSMGGKTFLFYTLLALEQEEADDSESNVEADQHTCGKVPQTVTSLRANIVQLEPGHATKKETKQKPIRWIDYPGSVHLRNSLPSLLVSKASHHKKSQSGMTTRIVLMLDSSKPSMIQDTAGILYHSILSHAEVSDSWLSPNNQNHHLKILIVCNKSDAVHAKNWRRIKIQLKTELEHLHRLSRVQTQTQTQLQTKEDSNGNPPQHTQRTLATLLFPEDRPKNISWDLLSHSTNLPIQFYFMSLPCHPTRTNVHLQALRTFVWTGDVLEDNRPILPISDIQST